MSNTQDLLYMHIVHKVPASTQWYNSWWAFDMPCKVTQVWQCRVHVCIMVSHNPTYMYMTATFNIRPLMLCACFCFAVSLWWECRVLRIVCFSYCQLLIMPHGLFSSLENFMTKRRLSCRRANRWRWRDYWKCRERYNYVHIFALYLIASYYSPNIPVSPTFLTPEIGRASCRERV